MRLVRCNIWRPCINTEEEALDPLHLSLTQALFLALQAPGFELSIRTFHKHHNLSECRKHEEIIHCLLTLKREDYKAQDHLNKEISACIFSALCTERCSQSILERKMAVPKQIQDFICLNDPNIAHRMKPIHRIWFMPCIILTMLPHEDHNLFVEIPEKHLDNLWLQRFHDGTTIGGVRNIDPHLAVKHCKNKLETNSFCNKRCN